MKNSNSMGKRSYYHHHYIDGSGSGYVFFFRHLHVKCALGFGCFLASTVANQSTTLGQTKVKGQKRPMLHTDSPQSGAINLQRTNDTNHFIEI